jgi:hypothetical protein
MDNKNRSLIPSQGGMLESLTLRIKLMMRLLADPRVNGLVKLLPFAGLFYWLLPLPVDNMIPVIDDVALVWLTTYFFVEFCPTEVVREHLNELTSNNAMVDGAGDSSSEIIDAEAKEIKD